MRFGKNANRLTFAAKLFYKTLRGFKMKELKVPLSYYYNFCGHRTDFKITCPQARQDLIIKAKKGKNLPFNIVGSRKLNGWKIVPSDESVIGDIIDHVIFTVD